MVGEFVDSIANAGEDKVKMRRKESRAERNLRIFMLTSYLRLYERCVIPGSFVKLGIDNVKRIVKKIIAMSIAENNSVFPDR